MSTSIGSRSRPKTKLGGPGGPPSGELRILAADKYQKSAPPARETLSAADYRALAVKAKSGNRGARGVWVGDEYFGSTIEAHHVINDVRVRERAGLVWNVRRQVAFRLHAANGEYIGTYKCDVAFDDAAGPHVVDVKGHPICDTELAKWKIHHAEIEYGITVEIVRLQVQRRKSGDRIVPIKAKERPRRRASVSKKREGKKLCGAKEASWSRIGI